MRVSRSQQRVQHQRGPGEHPDDDALGQHRQRRRRPGGEHPAPLARRTPAASDCASVKASTAAVSQKVKRLVEQVQVPDDARSTD